MKEAGVFEVGFGGGVRGCPERLYLTRAGAEDLALRRGCDDGAACQGWICGD